MITRRVAVLAAALALTAVPAPAVGGSAAALDRLAALASRHGGDRVPTGARGRAIAAWTVLAITAAGEDPASWPGPGGSARRALGPVPGGPASLALARWTVAAAAAHALDPVARASAVARLRDAPAEDPLLTGWCVIALVAAGARRDAAPAGAALQAAQRPTGGWATADGRVADVAATGAAVQALAALRVPAPAGVMRRARAWLARSQRRDGGWGAVPGAPSTAVDTAWAVLALRGLGEDPAGARWRRRAGGPLALIARHQSRDGAVADRADGSPSALALRLSVRALRTVPLWVPPPLAPRADRAPVVVRRAPAPGAAPGPLVLVVFRDDPGGTGVDPRRVRVASDGRDVTDRALVTPFGLQLPAAVLGRLPARVVLRLVDRAGNARVVRWVIGAGERGR